MKAFISKITRGYVSGKLRIHSSSAAFYIVVSALPLIAILIFTLTHLFPSLVTELEALLSGILPRPFYDELHRVILSLANERVPSLVPFGVIAAVWGSTKGVGGLCHGIESIYGIKETGGFISRSAKSFWRTALFYLMVISSLFIFALGRILHIQGTVLYLLVKLRIVIFAIVLSFFFALLYARLSNTGVRKQLFGGLLAALGWMLFSYFYSIYVSYALYSASIYAEMGTLIFFMLWCYFCVNIILVGALVNSIRAKR